MLTEKLNLIDILSLLILGVLLLWTGFFAGLKYREIKDKLNELSNPPEPEEEVKPTVTPTDPRFANENMINQDNSGVIEPKSPQLIEFEEEQALMKKVQDS